MRIFKKICGIFCLLEVLAGLGMLFTGQFKEHSPIGIFVCALFGFLSFLLLKPNRQKNNSDEIPKHEQSSYQLETPQETIEEIKAVKTSVHSDRLIEVIQQSYFLCLSTNNLSTFESRLEVATQKAYTLKQMEQAGLYNANPTSDYFLELLIGKRDELLEQFLIRAYKQVKIKAETELKSPAAIQKRIDKFLTEIEESVLDFDISVIEL